MDYKQEGEREGGREKRQRTACVPEEIQGGGEAISVHVHRGGL
jgi:hypothetical protein